MSRSYHFNEEIATLYGVDEAIIFDGIAWWVRVNEAEAREKSYQDGKYWTYRSYSAFAKLYPFYTEKQIRRIITNLVKAGLIEVGRYNEHDYDQTSWYTLTPLGWSYECEIPSAQTVSNPVTQPENTPAQTGIPPSAHSGIPPSAHSGKTPAQTGTPSAQTGTPSAQTGKPIPTNHNLINNYDSSSFSNENEGRAPPKRSAASKFKPPTLAEVAEYCRTDNIAIDAGAFVDHFTANGWRVGGKTAMKDWKAAVRNWARRQGDFNRSQQSGTAPPSARTGNVFAGSAERIMRRMQEEQNHGTGRSREMPATGESFIPAPIPDGG